MMFPGTGDVSLSSMETIVSGEGGRTRNNAERSSSIALRKWLVVRGNFL